MSFYYNANYSVCSGEGNSITYDNKTAWFKHGQFHRLNGPALEYDNGDNVWYMNGKCHRLDGPAFNVSHTTAYWQNGQRHRVDGPAVIGPNVEYWYQYDKLHRVDGPAMREYDTIEFWFCGIKCTYEEYLKLLKLDSL